MSQSGILNRGTIPPFTAVETLTGNSGGPVGPDGANNINVVGTGVITVVGNPGTNTLTITPSGDIASSFITNPATGTATPAAGVLTFAGAGGVTVTAGGSTVTIDGAAISAGTITGNTGGPQGQTAGNWNIVTANSTVVVAGAASTFTMDFGLRNLFLGVTPPLTIGDENVAVGFSAGLSITSSIANVLVGFNAGTNLVDGDSNVAIGDNALASASTGNSENVAVGANALLNLTTNTTDNTAVGFSCLNNLDTGSSNTALGFEAGNAYNGSESFNIVIGNSGQNGESGTTRIGTNGNQTTCYIAGIDGVDVGSVATVVTEAGDQLGTAVLTAGTGISITPGSNTITIDATTGGVTSITGNTGGAQTGAITIITANSTPIFAGAAGTLTLDFALTDNLLLGSSGGAITTADTNVGYGKLAAASLSTGDSNAFIGYESGVSYTTGNNSTAVGAFSMFSAVAGASNNTAIGYSSLYNLAGAGTNNTCLGLNSATAYTTTESNNIVIGSTGVIADNNRIRIGTNGTHTSCFITGIDTVNVGSVAKVVTMASDQLGTATITAGAGITVTPGANTITIASSATAFTWSVITVNQTAVVNNGYFCNKAGTLALALPAASAVGDTIVVTNENTALGVQFTQAAGQQILIANTNTTLGATGTLTSSAVGDTLQIVCLTANTIWRVTYMVGNWSVV